MTIVTTMEYNPKLGCLQEKKMNLRFVTYKTEDKAKRIGDVNINIADIVKAPSPNDNAPNLSKYKFHKS